MTRMGLLISQFEWVSGHEWVLAACGEGRISYAPTDNFTGNWCKIERAVYGVESEWIDGIMFDYDPVTESLAILQEDNRIYINGEIIDLSASIDEPIIEIAIEPVIDLSVNAY